MQTRADKAELKAAGDKSEGRELTPASVFWAFAAIFFLNLLLRVFYLRYDFVNGDEGVRALTATRLLEGARLYADVVTDKPPGATLFYAAVFALFGRSMKAVHLAAAVWNFATSIVIYLTAALVYGKRVGLWAALLFVYFSTNYFTQDMMAANTELLMVLPYTAAFYFFMKASRGQSMALLIAAGLMTGVAAMFKQVGVLALLFFGLNELFEAYNDRVSFRANWTKRSAAGLARLSLVALSFALVIAAFVFWLLGMGALADFWRNSVEINMLYVDAELTGSWLRFMVGRGLGYVLFNLTLWSLAAWTVVRSIKAVRHSTKRGNAQAHFNLSVALWATIGLASVLIGGRFLGHYFITILPALSLLAAPGIETLGRYLRDDAYKRKSRAAATALGLFFIFGFARMHHRTAVLAYETMSGARTRWSEAWGMSKRQHEAEAITEALRGRIEFGEPLYIWGYAHDVYWRTGCRPASRYLAPYYIDGRFVDAEAVAGAPDAALWREARANFIEDLRRARPRLILDVYGNMDDLPYADVVEFVKENYRDEGTVGPDPQRPFRVLRLKNE
ncbi:MAG TPA: glycosyltransferase family 39 protein [Blastocatellia bacterium]|nr:glycosyltransferase family 39 protein [Blastocatellia bacterium]